MSDTTTTTPRQRIYGSPEAAKKLGIAVITLRQRIDKGKVIPQSTGRTFYFTDPNLHGVPDQVKIYPAREVGRKFFLGSDELEDVLESQLIANRKYYTSQDLDIIRARLRARMAAAIAAPGAGENGA